MPSRSRQILDVAAVAFDEHGFHGVGMDEIGRRVGLSGPALYRHFGGKDDILAGLLDEALDELRTAVTTDTGRPLDDLYQALDHHVAYTMAHRPLISVYQREGSALREPHRSRFHRRRRRYLEQWSELVARAFPDLTSDDAAALTQVLLGLVFSPTSWPNRVARSSAGSQQLLALIRAGLAGMSTAGY